MIYKPCFCALRSSGSKGLYQYNLFHIGFISWLGLFNFQGTIQGVFLVATRGLFLAKH